MNDLQSNGVTCCKACGASMPIGSQFCPQCGARQNIAPAPTPSNTWFTQAGSLDDALESNHTTKPTTPPHEAEHVPESKEPREVQSDNVEQTLFIKPLRGVNSTAVVPVPLDPPPVLEDSLVVEETYCKSCSSIVPESSELCAEGESISHSAGKVAAKKESKHPNSSFNKHKTLIWASVAACLVIVAAFLLFPMGSGNKDFCPRCSHQVDFSKDVSCPNCEMAFTGAKPDGYEESDDLQSENDYNEYHRVFTQSEASSRGGLYVKKGDDFVSLDYALHPNSFYAEMYESAIVDYDTSRDITVALTEAPTLQMDLGEELVTFTSSNSYDVYLIKDEGYCFPAEINSYWSTNRNFEFIPMFNSGWEDTIIDGRNVEEVNGMEVSSEEDLLTALAQRNCGIYSFKKFNFTNDYIFSDEPSTVTCGYYSGTDYIERDLDVNVPLYVLDNAIEFPVIKGKDGYFTVDYSQLSGTGETILCLINDRSYDMGGSIGGFLLLKIFCD